MPYTVKDFWHDITKAHLDSLSPDERLAGLQEEELREVVRNAEQRLARSLKQNGPNAEPRANSQAE